MNIPILIVSYARPQGVARILAELSNYEGKIYISVDGVKSFNSKGYEEEFRQLVQDFSTKFENMDINLSIRPLNVGAAVNVVTSIDYCFEREKSLIILEDDLVISQDFLNFVNLILPKVSNNSDVKMITGTNSFSNEVASRDLFWCTYPIVWGWATTKNKWQELREAIFEKNFPNENFGNISAYYFFKTGKIRSLKGLIDAWDLPLAGTFHSKSWICLIPPKNLISNVGFDSNATHTFSENWPLDTRIEPLNSAKINPLELRSSNCLDNKIETRIYRIKKRHAFSLIKHYLKPKSWQSSTDTLFLKSCENKQIKWLSID